MTNPFALPNSGGATATATPPPPPTGNPFAPASPPVQPTPAAPAAPAYGGGEDPFSGPAPQQPRGPRVRDMYGRLLLVIPHKVESVPNRLRPGEMQDRMTADVIILDGGPINYGGRPEATPPVPHDKSAQVPHRNARMYLSQAGIISQCREALARRLTTGQPGMVLGRLAVGEAKSADKNPPYLLTPPTDADKAIARQYLATVDPFA